ncbi:hypothetical protein PX554_13640 [Sphingomonas sp. H39-1-10]|uniref:hypothetical protein n=1 Tax=Sphingomonas pollutisoli TaxID=3030829 RepID=UPI0023B8A66E|nr:hypothetical protein [Sphingomonas pollutisoli]MDF0489178.1 hypothetical protein [Sphingomonas pollutisoli]
MKPDPATLDRPVPAPFIHRQDCRCPDCPGGRRPLDPVTRATLLFSGGMGIGFLLVAASGNLEEALRALFGL